MALLRLTYSGNVYDAAPAGTVDFPLVTKGGKNIPYLQRSHIHVYRSADKGATWVELNRPTQWGFDSTGTIVRLTAAVTPDYVMVRRITPYQELYTKFQDSSLLTADQLNEAEKFGLYVNQEQSDSGDQGFWNDPRQVVTKPMQRAGTWPADGKDNYIATTDAISARLDPYVQDGTPASYGLPEKEQNGKQWFDTDDLVQRFWDSDAGAWVTLANTGPVGPTGPQGPMGFWQTIVSDAVPTQRTDGTPLQNGDLWLSSNKGEVFTWYKDADSNQWLSLSIPGPVGPAGPAGGVGPAGPTGAASTVPGPAGPPGPLPSITADAPITAAVVAGGYELDFDPIPLTFLP